jgi:hypothetical protein
MAFVTTGIAGFVLSTEIPAPAPIDDTPLPPPPGGKRDDDTFAGVPESNDALELILYYR